MKKKIGAAGAAVVLIILLVQFLIPQVDKDSANERPGTRGMAKTKIVQKPLPSPRQVPDNTRVRDEDITSPSIAENGMTPQVMRTINQNASKNTISFNGENYKLVKGFFATKVKEDTAPLFKLFGYHFYKGSTADGINSDQMSIVINENTDALGVLTGKITLTLNSNTAIEELSNRYDLTVEYSNEKAGVAVVSSSRPTQSIYLALTNDSNVTEAKLEIIESQHHSK